jgi:hypothetical protein
MLAAEHLKQFVSLNNWSLEKQLQICLQYIDDQEDGSGFLTHLEDYEDEEDDRQE